MENTILGLPIPLAESFKKPVPTTDRASSTSFNELLVAEQGRQLPQNTVVKSKNSSLILVGEITNQTRTVSELLMENKQFKSSTWEILGAPQNRNREYTRIQPGTLVYYNPKDKKLTWEKRAPELAVVQARSSVQAEANAFPNGLLTHPLPQSTELPPTTNLSQAVGKYMGTPYKELNCYELVVKGLQSVGITYRGKDGLQAKLTRMAREDGLPENGYLTGEGIIKAAGSMVLSKNYSGVSDWKSDAAALIKEIEPLLGSGQILSFSTKTKGHTGVVSKTEGQWTFINSGLLDNSIYQKKVNRGVGEELLQEEIRNWFKLAHRKEEPLRVSLGRVNQDNLETSLAVYPSPDPLTEHI